MIGDARYFCDGGSCKIGCTFPLRYHVGMMLINNNPTTNEVVCKFTTLAHADIVMVTLLVHISQPYHVDDSEWSVR